MKKKILAGVLGASLLSSVAFAAPVVDLKKGEANIGYNFSNLDPKVEGFSADKADSNALYLEYAVSDKVIIGIENSNKIDIKKGDSPSTKYNTMDIYAKYKLGENIYATLGNHQHTFKFPGAGVPEDNTNDVALGIEGYQKLGDKVTGYAGYKTYDGGNEWKIGTVFALSNKIQLDLNYKHREETAKLSVPSWTIQNKVEFEGVGFGVNYKF